MRRVFIVGTFNFPRGGATANYIQYLMSAVKECGYETILISTVNAEYLSTKGERISYKGFEIEPLVAKNNRIIRRYQYRSSFADAKIALLKKNNITSDDVVICLGSNRRYLKKLISYRNKIGFKIIGAVLELFDKDNYSGNAAEYKEYINSLDKLFPMFDMIMPISTFIDEYYRKKSVKTVCVPIMADYSEFEFKPKSFEKIRFVIPANGKMKDSLSSMLKAFCSLTEAQSKGVELHLCGIKEQSVKELLSKDEYDFLCQFLIIHKWLKYEELVELYQSVHYLVLARGTSQMTLANFPSKVPETMSFGIVPLASEVGDYTKYYLRDGVDSIFIQGCSEEACKEAVQKAISLSEAEYLQMSNSAIECVKTRFDYHVWVDTIKKMIESL